jgi:hypothetical protein
MAKSGTIHARHTSESMEAIAGAGMLCSMLS